MVSDFLVKYSKHFHSLRYRDESIILLDMFFPIKWEIQSFLMKWKIEVNAEENIETVLLTFVSYGEEPLEQKIELLLNCIDEIIKYNNEKEEKDRLLNERIEELKNFVNENDIETINKINFNTLKDEEK